MFFSHTVTEGSSDTEDRHNDDVTNQLCVATDVIVQGELYDEIMMEVKKVTDPRELSHDLKHGGNGIQFNNVTHVDDVEHVTYHVAYNEASQFHVTFELDNGGNFRNIHLLTRVKQVFKGTLNL